jgi:hypothetical protein
MALRIWMKKRYGPQGVRMITIRDGPPSIWMIKKVWATEVSMITKRDGMGPSSLDDDRKKEMVP